MSNSRRKFIRNSAVAGAGFFIVPRHVIGRGFIAPSDKLRIAGIGAGGKGQSDLSEFSKRIILMHVQSQHLTIHMLLRRLQQCN